MAPQHRPPTDWEFLLDAVGLSVAVAAALAAGVISLSRTALGARLRRS
jgi:hypothetical protein